MRLTRHEVVLWAEERAQDHRRNAETYRASGMKPFTTTDALRIAEYFEFVVRVLREADLDPQQSTGQVQDVPEVDAQQPPTGVSVS